MQRNGRAGTGTSLEEVKRRLDASRRVHRWLGRIPNKLWRDELRIAAGDDAENAEQATRQRSTTQTTLGIFGRLWSPSVSRSQTRREHTLGPSVQEDRGIASGREARSGND